MGLRKLKVSDHLIQMYCRWASPRSLEAYALLDMEQYADQIAEAELQTFVTISGKPDYQLPQIDDDDRHIHMAAMAEQLDLPEDPHGWAPLAVGPSLSSFDLMALHWD